MIKILSIINKAKECLRIIETSKTIIFETKFYKNYIESLESNLNFKTHKEYGKLLSEKGEENTFDLSIYATNKILINHIDDEKISAFEKYNNKTFGFQQETMNIMRLINFCENQKFIYADNFLKKYSNIKKLGLTNLNVTEIYYKFGKYESAIEYLRNINDPYYLNHKVNMLTYIERYDIALEVIISEKKVINIEDLVNNILKAKPNLKEKAQELCEKYKVKMQLI